MPTYGTNEIRTFFTKSSTFNDENTVVLMQFVVCVLFNEKPSVNAIWLEKKLKGFSMIYVYFQIFFGKPFAL